MKRNNRIGYQGSMPPGNPKRKDQKADRRVEIKGEGKKELTLVVS